MSSNTAVLQIIYRLRTELPGVSTSVLKHRVEKPWIRISSWNLLETFYPSLIHGTRLIMLTWKEICAFIRWGWPKGPTILIISCLNVLSFISTLDHNTCSTRTFYLLVSCYSISKTSFLLIRFNNIWGLFSHAIFAWIGVKGLFFNFLSYINACYRFWKCLVACKHPF